MGHYVVWYITITYTQILYTFNLMVIVDTYWCLYIGTYFYLRNVVGTYDGYLLNDVDRLPDDQPAQSQAFDDIWMCRQKCRLHSDNNNGALFYFVVPDCDGQRKIGHCPKHMMLKNSWGVLSVLHRWNLLLAKTSCVIFMHYKYNITC